MLRWVHISRVPDQNGVSQAWYIVEIHHSGREPSIYTKLWQYCDFVSLQQLYKSGLFFIENVFYNDMRESDNKDYSQYVLFFRMLSKNHLQVSAFFL